jgi:hypothetical protein
VIERGFYALIDWSYRHGVSYGRQMAVFLVLAAVMIFTLGWVVPMLALGLL